jgi:hypothetical protein
MKKTKKVNKLKPEGVVSTTKNNKQVTIAVPTFVQHGPHKFGLFQKEELIYSNPAFKQKVTDKEYVLQNKEGMIGAIFFNSERNYPRVHIHASLKQLKKFVKLAEQRTKKFKKQFKSRGLGNSHWMHLSGDTSFFITEK